METPLEPDALTDREAVAYETETRTVTDPEFETARQLQHRVTVGIVSQTGEVLFVADGARGWSLPAAPVDHDEPWADATRRVCDSLTGVDLEIAEPVRVREVVFRHEDDPERERTTYDVLVRTEPVPGRPVADDPTLDGDDVTDLLWLADAPDESVSGLAADVDVILATDEE